MQEKKYGLQLRVTKSQQKQQQARPPIPKPAGFNDDDDDDVEREISRQSTKNKSLKDVEEQHKKALEEDPSVFDYDGVYDDMKAKVAQPRAQDRQQRQPKYIQALVEKAKQREREHEIVYERKLAKERSKDDHLYADKDKFVTSAYKRKLAEQAKWMEEERLRELREQKDDVTKKGDLTDFYFNLGKNVAFGAAEKCEVKPEKQEQEPVDTREEPKKPERREKEPVTAREELRKPERHEKEKERGAAAPGVRGDPSSGLLGASSSRSEDKHQAEPPIIPERSPAPSAIPRPPPPTSGKENPANDEPKRDHHKKSEDALAAAKERFLARKRAKAQ